MFRYIDNFLNKITMYRLVLYVLITFFLMAVSLTFLGLLPYSPLSLVFSFFLITTICLITNIIFAWAFKVSTNVESVYITAFILVLIISPARSVFDSLFFSLAIWSSILSMAFKYILAINKKHLFNPAAVAVAIVALFLGQSASWWIGTMYMLPIILVGGFLITRKIRRFDLVLSFLIVATISTLFTYFPNWVDLFGNLKRLIDSTSLVFFATVMLTEPLTMPPTRFLRIIYASIVGFLFAPFVHIGSVYSTPELALVIGNIFSYLVSPKERLTLTLKEVKKVANDTYDFIFKSDKKIKFKAGQYLEWTIPDSGADSRGNRRYFTLASSPTESDVVIGVKFYPKPSSFKQKLLSMKEGATVIASQRAGEFILPEDKNKKLVFIAGGIGVTPFRSIIQYLIDKGERRNIIIFYSNKSFDDIAYKDIFDKAYENLNIKTVYTLTDTQTPSSWTGNKGFIDTHMISLEAPDFKERVFYISGPHSMVTSFKDTLHKMNVPRSHIKVDFFPGFA